MGQNKSGRFLSLKLYFQKYKIASLGQYNDYVQEIDETDANSEEQNSRKTEKK